MDRIAPPLLHFSNFQCSKAQSALHGGARGSVPGPLERRKAQGLFQPLEKHVSRHLFGSQAQEMSGGHLYIDHLKAPGL